ncbi:MAG: glycerol-3-phosphate acyltransferase [candidate division NC10 bacterium]|nr:glycerol-3-phosphate acyltransferase [candidate division NC10 bacterium]
MFDSENLLRYAFLALGSYFLGSLPTGVLVARRYRNVDLTRVGSQKTGATNVARTLGLGAGAIVLVGDLSKGALAVWLAQQLIGSPIALGIAWLFAVWGHMHSVFLHWRGGRGVGTGLGGLAIILLPRMIPPITYALGVAQIFYTLELVDTYLGVALAHVSVCAPYAILVLSATFEGLDERVLEAAGVCGANTVKRFFYVVLPLIMPGILASMIFSFTHSYNEFTLTLLTYGPHTVTLPVRTYLAVGDGYWEITSAMAMLMVVPSLLILAVIQRRAKPEKLVGGFKGV